MQVKQFYIEESKVNNQCLILVAETWDGKRFVVSGDFHAPTYAIPYERAWDTTSMDDKKQPNGKPE